MMDKLKKETNWVEHYSSVYSDPLYHLSADASQADMFSFFQKVVRAHFDSETGLLRIEVQAFDPDFAEKVLAVLLKESESFVNELSHKLTRDQLEFVEKELITARSNYDLRRDELLRFQAANNIVDAEATITARSTMIATMEGELATANATLSALSASLSADSPQVQQQRKKIRALEKQLAAENRRLISTDIGGGKLNSVAAKFRDLQIQASIAEEAYKITLASLENTRIEINKKFRSLAVVVAPNLPDSAIYPAKMYNLITILLALMALFGIVRFVVATIDDHKD